MSFTAGKETRSPGPYRKWNLKFHCLNQKRNKENNAGHGQKTRQEKKKPFLNRVIEIDCFQFSVRLPVCQISLHGALRRFTPSSPMLLINSPGILSNPVDLRLGKRFNAHLISSVGVSIPVLQSSVFLPCLETSSDSEYRFLQYCSNCSEVVRLVRSIEANGLVLDV